MTTRLTAALLALCLAAPARAQVPEGDLAQILPSGTMVFISIDELSRVFTLDPDGAMMKLVEHDAVQQAFEGFYDKLGEMKDKEFLLTLDLEEDELARLFGGRVTLAIPEILLEESEVETDSGGGNVQANVRLEFDLGRGVILMADFGGTRDRFEELLGNFARLMEEKDEVHAARLIIEEFEKTRLYMIEEETEEGEIRDSTWMALVDDLLLMSDEEQTIKDFVDLAENGAPEGDRLADDPRYVDALDRIGDADAVLYVNLGELLPMVNEYIEYQIKRQGRSVEQFLRAEDLIAGLRLDAVKSLFGSARVADDEASLVFGFTHADTDFGLHTLLTYDDSGVAIPPYFNSDFHSGSISRFDLSAAYERFDKMLRKVSPYAHTLFMTQVRAIESRGFDLRDAVLNNVDSSFVELLGFPEATVADPDDLPTQAYVVRVKDPQTLAESLAELGEEMAEDDPVEFMNEQIQVIPLPFGGSFNGEDPRLSYAVVENYLVVAMGEPKMVENIIAHIKNPGESLLEDPDLMDAFDTLPSEDMVGLGFVNIADLVTSMVRGGETGLLFQASREDDKETIGDLMQAHDILKELPDVSDLKYYAVSKTYKSPDAFVQRMLLRPNLDNQ